VKNDGGERRPCAAGRDHIALFIILPAITDPDAIDGAGGVPCPAGMSA
jgi:hypothetical protein